MKGECTVGIFPAEAHTARQRLFHALEGAFDVTFVPRREGEYRNLDAAVVLGDGDAMRRGLETAGVASYHAPAGMGDERDSPGSVTFSSADGLDGRLRGRRLQEGHAGGPPLRTARPDAVLATTVAGPVWARYVTNGCVRHDVSSSVVELGPRDRLKERVAAGRFLSLLPLVQFLREVCEADWERPPLRASFILDDPNLHWRSYGYLRYPELAAHARHHGYHVGIAMVPLDAAYAHPATVRLFRESPQLSLLVHGNDHVKRELAQPMAYARAVALLSQAMRRMAAFERRNGLPVCRVMVPPHYDCSEQMMAAMVETGFEAVCYTGPVDAPVEPLAGWAPADVHLGGGLPGLHRLPFDAPTDELVLRAFLDHAILLYGHHTDLVDGLDVLGKAAERVRGLGDVAWMPSSDVARSSYLVRQDGGTAHVRVFSRRVAVTPRNGTRCLQIELPPGAAKREEAVRVAIEGERSGWVTTGTPPGLPVAGRSSLVVELAPPPRAESAPVRAPWRPWPLVRRCLTETRDRVSPLLGVEWSQRQVP